MNDSKDHHSTGSHVEPIITGFGQQKMNGECKKVLDCSLEKCNGHSGIPKLDVCLKPLINSVPTELDTLTILSDNIVACNGGNARDDVTEYTYSSVFGPNVDQKKFFDTWVYDKVLRFLNGNNELLFAYGITNSGKTYTIHGNVNDPGMIPRTLLSVFNSLNKKLMSQCKYKPDEVIAACILDEKLMKSEENIKNNWSNEKTQDDFKSQVDECQTIHSIVKMFNCLKNYELSTSLDHGNVSYSVWISYSEIYNESIYDLLVAYSSRKKLMCLKLSTDQKTNVYVKNLTHVFVQSAEEAYKIMCFGRNNSRIADNNLNTPSNRSHCIFTLKLLRIENIENPTKSVISSISFCDLAGSQRLKNTKNIGERLTESININTSILVLNKCFSVLRDNQKKGENNLVPYRESKLTQMFQTALAGYNGTGISIAVNVNMFPNLFDENKQVFMSALISIEEHEARFKELEVTFRIEFLQRFSTILDSNKVFHNKQKKIMVNNIIEMYENKIKQMKDNHCEEIRERDEKLAFLSNTYESEMENYEFRTGEIENKMKKLLAEMNALKNVHDLILRQEYIDAKNLEIDAKDLEIENYKVMLDDMSAEYEQVIADFNDMLDKFDEVYQDIEDKNLEIERLTGSLKAKNDCISVMELLEEERVSVMVKELSDINKESEIAKLQERIQKLENELRDKNNRINELQTTFDNLKTANVKPSTKSIAGVTNLCNVQLPLQMVDVLEEKENVLSKPDRKPRRCKNKTQLTNIKVTKNLKTGTPDSCDRNMDEERMAIESIQICTRRRRKLLDSKAPLFDSTNKLSDNSMNSVLSPTRAPYQISKLHVKK